MNFQHQPTAAKPKMDQDEDYFASMPDASKAGGAGWMDWLSRFAKGSGGTGQRIGAAVGGENSETYGQLYDQLMTPPGAPPLLDAPKMPFSPAAPIQFGQMGGGNAQLLAMLAKILGQGGR